MKSIGDILASERKRRKLTIENIQKAVKIHPKYLKALEDNDYSVFDGKVHARGFLRLYADFLGLNISEVMAFWRRDYEAFFEKNSPKSSIEKLRPVELPKFVVTPGKMLLSLVGIFIVLFFGYLFYQYKSFNAAPDLQISNPQNNAVLESDILDVIGKTDIDASVFINNQKISLGIDGSFITSIKLKEGLNTISVVSINKLEKKTEIIRTVVYRAVPSVPPVLESTSVLESTP